MPTLISLVIIDDNALLREGLAAMIDAQPGFRVLSSSGDGDQALKAVQEEQPDIVLLDLGLADRDSLDLTMTIHLDAPATRVIVMGLLPLQEDVADYVRAGASGFVMKDASLQAFFATIQAVATGNEVLPQALTNSLFTQIMRNATRESRARVTEAVSLTEREREVISLLGEGLSNKDIAARMDIAVQTVKSHVHNILEKLALHTRLELGVYSHTSRKRSAPA